MRQKEKHSYSFTWTSKLLYLQKVTLIRLLGIRFYRKNKKSTKNGKKRINMGKNGFYQFHCDFAKNFAQYTSFSPKFRCSIVGGTSDHLVNHLHQRGKLSIFYLFHGLALVFIGNFQDFRFILGP
jgi:hypothetical protein